MDKRPDGSHTPPRQVFEMHTFFIAILVIASIVALTFIVERGLALRWNRIIPPPIENAVSFYRSPDDLPRLRAVCEENPSTCARLLLFVTAHLDWSRSETVELLETRARHEVTHLERGLIVLEILIGIAPLLGLVGTIYGLITLFGSMSNVSGVDSVKFAQGISTALYATLLGLLVAIPALIGWSYYSKKVENLTVELESVCDEFLRKHYHVRPADEQLPKASAPPLARTKLR
jgi:biopolymer transport protein ExbB